MRKINLFKNKKGLEFKSATYALIAVGMLISAIGVIVGGWNIAYDSGLTYDLAEYSSSSSTNSYINSQKDAISSTSVGVNTESFESSVLRGGFGVLLNMFKPFEVVFGDGGMIDSITERFGIPDYIRQGLTALMVAAITFTLIAIIYTKFRSNI